MLGAVHLAGSAAVLARQLRARDRGRALAAYELFAVLAADAARLPLAGSATPGATWTGDVMAPTASSRAES